MSSIVLLVGQCGNQVGHDLMSLIDNSDVHPLCHRDGKLRCVCVDSESKVIGRNYCDDTRRSALYREGNMISGTIVVHSLAGGTGSGLGSHVVEAIRDTYPLGHVMSAAVSPHASGDSPLQHYNSLLSLASLQRHADGVLLFNNDDILRHVSVHRGIVSRQKNAASISLKDMNSYISASLAGLLQPLGNKPRRMKGNVKDKGNRQPSHTTRLKEHGLKHNIGKSNKTDPISRKLSYSHDETPDRSDILASSSSEKPFASFSSDEHSMNMLSSTTDLDTDDIMARQPRSTASALLRYQGIVRPSTSRTENCQSSSLETGVSCGNEPWEMLHSICPEPNKKFATLHHLAKSKVSWEGLTNSLLHSLRRYDKQGVQFSTISSLLVARGDLDGSFAQESAKIEEKLRLCLGCVGWNPFPVDFWISRYNPVGPKESQSLTLCLNSTKIVETLADVIEKSRAMFDAGAYLHWFWKHGCSKNDFLDAFDTLETVIEDYKLASG
ncbi:uncharacterized protein LOC114955200 isoform X2 [Acropora millepora]|uniref:uncharacterized protein LOC114955200 isoform X2 n=1 Tax=Acropora millepora TaxID=45264 RepID=UPI001CF39DE6|nr:uncharacterized protein LOC114955200 isoform X2 [Acropora millepora]